MLVTLRFITLSFSLFLGACNNSSYNESTSNNSYSDENKTSLNNISSFSRWPSATLGSSGLNLKVSQEVIDELQNGASDISNIYQKWNSPLSGQTLLNESVTAIPNFEPNDLTEYGSDNVFGIYLSRQWFSDQDPFALAITQYFGVRNQSGALELVHGDIILNYSGEFLYFSDPTDAAVDEYDLNSIILHEVGHFLGLGHQSYSADSVMRPTLIPISTERNLYNLDKETIDELYGSESSSSTYAITASSFSKSNNRSAKPKGKLVRGVINLLKDGTCIHKENGREIHRHKRK